MSKLIIETEEEFMEAINSTRCVMYFFAPWCGPCKMFKKTFEDTAKYENFQDIVFKKIDIDEFEDLASKFEIKAIPTIIVFENGHEVNRSIGIPENFESFVEEHF